MWVAWLNRLGIILNVLAAFLITPDMLGQRRLESWLQSLERLAGSLLQALNRVFEEIILPGQPGEKYVRQNVWGFIGFSALSTLASAILFVGFYNFTRGHGWAWVLMGAAYVLSFIINLFDSDDDIGDVLLSSLALLFTGPLFGLSIPVFVLYLIIDSVVAGLRSKGRMRAALLPLGVVMFILGALLQMLATFL